MNHVGLALSCAIVILGGCTSTSSSPARGDVDASQSAEHAHILRIFDEISIPLGTPRAEVQRLLPFPVEDPAASSDSLLQYDGLPEKDEVVFAVAVDGVFQKVGGFPPFTARFHATFVADRLANFGLLLPDPHPRDWIVMNGRVSPRETAPAVTLSVLLAQMEALKRTIAEKRKMAEGG